MIDRGHRYPLLATVVALLVGACATPSVAPTQSGIQPSGSSATPAGSGGGWQLLNDFPGDGASAVNSIVATDGGFIAVGTVADDDATCVSDINEGRVWTSPEGTIWSSRPHDTFAQSDLTQLVVFHDDLYAFGSSGTLDEESACGAPANPPGVNVWRSDDDGATWERLQQSPEIVRASLGDVVVAGEQLVIVGSAVTGDGNDQAASWSSGDGLAWTAAALPPATSFLGSAAARDNVVVGFGVDQDFPLPWISRDAGGHWYEESVDVSGAESDEGEVGFGFDDAIDTDSGYVAVGDACCVGTAQIVPVAYVTPDGTQWQGAPAANDAPQTMRRVGRLPAGLLAVGFRTYLDEAPPASELGGRSWTSADGKTWLPGPRFAELGDGYVTALAVSNRGAVVAGTSFIESATIDDTGLRVWFAPVSAFAAGTSN